MFFTKKDQEKNNQVAVVDNEKANPSPQVPITHQVKVTPLEESWKFLKNTAIFVYSKLDKNKRDEILDKGRAIMSQGAQYHHIVYDSGDHNKQ